MADTSKTIDYVVAGLAKALGYLDKFESRVDSIASKGTKVGDAFSRITSGAREKASASAGGGNLMANSLGHVPEFSDSPRVAAAGGGGAGGGGGGAGGGGGGAGGGVTAVAAATPPGRTAAIAAGVASAAYNLTPGTSDSFALMGALFPTTFAATGPYDRGAVSGRIIDSIGVGASSTTDPATAALVAASRGFVFSENDRSVDYMLRGAEFANVMTGMSNQAAVAGLTDIYRGGSGVSSRLLSMGVASINNDGSLRDLGEIVNELLKRGNIDNMTEEEFNRSMAMGFMGQTFSYAFGDSPELYSQAMTLARTQVKNNNNVLRLGDRSAFEASGEVGRKDSPFEVAGRMTSAQFESLVSWNDSIKEGAALMSHFNASLNNVIGVLAKVPVLGPMLGFSKGVIDGLAGTLRSTGGEILGQGSTTHDSIKAYLSPGEYVLNARAASMIGRDALDDMNSLGHEFGDGFASPAPVFLSKGGSAKKTGHEKPAPTKSLVSGADVVAFASNYLGTKYVYGGSSPKTGWDCSKFIQWVYKQHGVSTPGRSGDFISYGSSVSREDLQPGDVLVWHTQPHTGHGDPRAGHVSIYAGNGEHIHAKGKDWGTVREKIDNWYWSKFKTARRIDGAATAPSSSGASTGEPGIDGQQGVDGSQGTYLLSQIAGIMSGTTIERAAPFSVLTAFSLSGLSGRNGQMGSVSTNAAQINAAAPNFSLGAGASRGSSSGIEQRGLDLLGTIGGVLSKGSNLITGGASGVLEAFAKYFGIRLPRDAGNSTSDSTGTQSGTSGGELTENDFAARILRGIGAPVAGVALNAMLTWMRHEGGHWVGRAKFNPLNTSMIMDGNDPSINSDGVKIYDNWEEGVAATIKTLLLNKHGYPEIVSAFRKNKSVKDIYRAINASSWGTNTLPAYAHGAEYISKNQVANLHQGELVMPAAQAQMFRMALQEALSGARSGPEQVNVTLNIERASDEEAERFARKVISIVKNEEKHDRLATL